jgi:hypothetical protein
MMWERGNRLSSTPFVEEVEVLDADLSLSLKPAAKKIADRKRCGPKMV